MQQAEQIQKLLEKALAAFADAVADNIADNVRKEYTERISLLEHQLRVAREQEDVLLSKIEELQAHLSQEQEKSEAEPELEWDHCTAGKAHWWTAIPIVNSDTLKYQIMVTALGKFSVASSSLRLFPIEYQTASGNNHAIPEPFETLAQAQAWCQQNEISRKIAFELKGGA